MKKICLIYARYLEEYIINERGEDTIESVPEENIKNNIEEALDLVKSKYSGRNAELLLQNIPEDKEFFIKEYMQDTKIKIR